MPLDSPRTLNSMEVVTLTTSYSGNPSVLQLTVLVLKRVQNCTKPWLRDGEILITSSRPSIPEQLASKDQAGDGSFTTRTKMPSASEPLPIKTQSPMRIQLLFHSWASTSGSMLTIWIIGTQDLNTWPTCGRLSTGKRSKSVLLQPKRQTLFESHRICMTTWFLSQRHQSKIRINLFNQSGQERIPCEHLLGWYSSMQSDQRLEFD